jgi:hypothetical protein
VPHAGSEGASGEGCTGDVRRLSSGRLALLVYDHERAEGAVARDGVLVTRRGENHLPHPPRQRTRSAAPPPRGACASPRRVRRGGGGGRTESPSLTSTAPFACLATEPVSSTTC